MRFHDSAKVKMMGPTAVGPYNHQLLDGHCLPLFRGSNWRLRLALTLCATCPENLSCNARFTTTIIRNERSLNAIREYIARNPVNWEEDIDNPINLQPRHAGRRKRTAAPYAGRWTIAKI
jgi:hypothetical protein